LRNRVRRDDARSARICQVVAGAFSGKSFPIEDFMPQEHHHQLNRQPLSGDDELAGKLQNVMQKLGWKPDIKPAPERTDDEFRQHIWNLMGIGVN
jgi:hypothetical protein